MDQHFFGAVNQMERTGGTGSDNSLQHVLLRDWGYDLPIFCEGEGWGTRANPIALYAKSPTVAARTAYRTVHGLQRGLGEATRARVSDDLPVGVMWRPRGDIFAFDADLGLFRFSSERKIMTASEVTSEDFDYWFTIPGSSPDYLAGRSQRAALILDHDGFKLPMYLGWLHTNESGVVHHGGDLGVGVGFHGLGAKATVYCYPIPSAAAAQVDPAEGEFLQACRGVESVTLHLQAWPDRPPINGVHMRSWRLGPEDEELTILGVTSVKGNFLKFRITWARDHTLDDAGNEFVKDFLRWISFIALR